MLEKQYCEDYLKAADILQDSGLLVSQKALNDNIKSLKETIYNLSHFKNENTFNKIGALSVFLFFIPFCFIFFQDDFQQNNPGVFPTILASFIFSVLFGVAVGMISTLTVRYLIPLFNPTYKKSKKLLDILKKESHQHHQDTLQYLTIENNQHLILKMVGQYYDFILNQFGLEFTETLSYTDLREELIQSFILKNHDMSLNLIQKFNFLINHVETKYDKWSADRQYREKYQHFLKTQDSIDTFENSQEAQLKRMI